MTVRTIVVGTDFSEHASAALRWAGRFARRSDAQVVLVHGTPSLVSSRSAVELHEQLEQRLEEERLRLEASGARVEAVWREGVPWEVVCEVARERAADVIVVGKRGGHHDRWINIALGGTADRILRAAPCPVITVPRIDVEQAGDGPVCVALDFGSACMRALDLALGFVTPDHPLRLLHVVEPLVYTDGSGIVWSADGCEEEEVEAATARLETIAAPLRDAGRRVDVRVLVGDPASIIIDDAEADRACMVALGTHGRQGLPRLLLGSVAERVVHASDAPVIVVRNRDAEDGEG